MPVIPKSGRKKGFPTRPLLRIDIELAQRNTKSGMAAAKWLHVNYATYKKWSKYYGLFDSHKNEKGVGVKRPRRKWDYSLERIFAGDFPYYSRKRLKERLVQGGMLEEKCALCGFSEKRLVDNKCPLTIVTIDESKPALALDNIHLLCYNCNFLNNATVTVPDIRPNTIEKDIKIQLNLSDEEILALQSEAISEAQEELNNGLSHP